MTELRLHRELYAGAAVDRAVAVYTPHATIERRDDASHWVIAITSRTPERERRVAGELGNYALGLTAKERKR